MDYIGMNAPNGIIQIVLRRQRVVDTRRCGSVIILSVNAGNQRLGKFNQINFNELIVENTQEAKSVSDLLQQDIDAGNVNIFCAANSTKKVLYVRYPDGELSNGGKCYKIACLPSQQFQRWAATHYANGNNDSAEVHKAIEKLVYNALQNENLPALQVFTRAGYCKGKDGEEVYLCLHDQRRGVIRITISGRPLTYEGNVPVIFENPGTMSGLASPVYERDDKGKIDAIKTLAHLNDLRKYVNVSDEDFCLVIAWLLIALYPNPNVDAPVLWIEGERNTGKTTASKILKGLVDPCTARMLSQYVSGNDFLDTLNSQYVSVIDNVSAITPKFNDMLCRAVTDEKIITVIANGSEYHVRQHSNIVVNGLRSVSKTPELRERCFTVRTRELTNEQRLTNEELEAGFERDARYILGGLILALHLGLKNMDYKPPMSAYTRMLDAGQLVARVANAAEKCGLPFTEQDFMSALKAQKADQTAENAEALEEDMIAQAIYEMAMEQPATGSEVVVWDDNSELLREKIEKRLRGKNGGKTPEDFPATPQKLGRKLSAISELLSEVGIHIERVRREGSKRYTRITYTPDTEPEQIASAESSTSEATSDNEPQLTSSIGSTASAEAAENVSLPDEAQKKTRVSELVVL
ncbi:MAG: hypothetical protein IJQ08_02645 [Synergistaceae bacterium]|nr:hypothetical protein [Synergistaceae bacterium]